MNNTTVPREIIRNLVPKFLPNPKNTNYIPKVIFKTFEKKFYQIYMFTQSMNSFFSV